MARYEHLPIYKSVYDLNIYFFQLARGFPKDYKYGLAMQIEQLLNSMLDVVIEANSSLNKTLLLKDGFMLVEKVKFKARMLKDLKVMSLKSYQHFFTQLVDISKQFEKWCQWSEKGICVRADYLA